MPNSATDQIVQALITNDAYKIYIDAITISHSVWDEPFRFIRNYVNQGSIEYGGDTYTYLPIVLTRAGQDGNLNQSWSITLQDLNTEIQEAEALIPLDSDELPEIELRTFEYDKRTGSVVLLEGPYITDTAAIGYTDKGAAIDAQAARVNVSGCGIKMTPDRLPTLRPLMR